jgi:hypothetical protein
LSNCNLILVVLYYQFYNKLFTKWAT